LTILFALATGFVAAFVIPSAVAETISRLANESVAVPSWFWGTLFAGAVQGLVWYGAINSKLTWLASRLETLEQRFNRHIEGAKHRASDNE
jgi:hypothetical protein